MNSNSRTKDKDFWIKKQIPRIGKPQEVCVLCVPKVLWEDISSWMLPGRVMNNDSRMIGKTQKTEIRRQAKR